MLLSYWDCHRRIYELSLWDCYFPALNFPRKWWVLRGIENPETVAQHQMDATLMVMRFKKEIERIGGDIIIIQDTLLAHDSAEPYMKLWDVTPHCKVPPEVKRAQEESTFRRIHRENPYMLRLWLESEDGLTLDWRIAKEIDKLHWIDKARYYEDKLDMPWLTTEFFTHSVCVKNEVSIDFLLRYVVNLYENKPR